MYVCYLCVLLYLYRLKTCKHNMRSRLWRKLLAWGLHLFQSTHIQVAF